jgi:hypothetical protein
MQPAYYNIESLQIPQLEALLSIIDSDNRFLFAKLTKLARQYCEICARKHSTRTQNDDPLLDTPHSIKDMFYQFNLDSKPALLSFNRSENNLSRVRVRSFSI